MLFPCEMQSECSVDGLFLQQHTWLKSNEGGWVASDVCPGLWWVGKLEGDPGVDPEHAGGIPHLACEHLGIIWEYLESFTGKKGVCSSFISLSPV